ncbi:IucA/IucC family C-terminal-domain containing protein [Sinorhizobium mexicanum]|uniref:Ferric iron reductase n=1 Tax=Sinorhizobium mexicanum TaxID=375549 RepID=A0A859QV69_9HYPH|nr:IucA/IucC family C-terminal-domain containing protein [Sinorhizobium mexicanum]MBP1883424.1 ferric iron reductase protein FhuF [Sinorhizobium mexicanum]QLL62621.1 ferric iron reductase [Sinorhizobium mexicanum]
MDKAPKLEPEDAQGEGEARAAVAWFEAAFPEVACSLILNEDVRLPSAFWAEGSRDLETCLAYQDRFAAGMDDKVRAAHLIAFYSHQLSLAATAIYLCCGRVPHVTGLRFEHYVRPREAGAVDAGRFHFCMRLKEVSSSEPEDADRLFHDLFVAHLKPVIAHLKRRCGLSLRAQWRLAADGLAGAFLEVGRRRGTEAEAIAQALAIVKRAGSPLHSEALCYETIGVAAADGTDLSRTYRIRGGCCLYYRTDGGSYCDSCVLLDPEARRERLRAHLLGAACDRTG